MAGSKQVKQKAAPEVQDEILQEEVPQKAAPEVQVDPWQQMVTVRLERSTNGEPNYVIASVNGRVFQIKRGEEVNVPKPIAEVLANSFAAEEAAYTFIDNATRSKE